MLFMLRIGVALSPETPAPDKEALRARENARAAELIAAGRLIRIWRVVGRVANFSVWQSRSRESLHEDLMFMPMFPYMKIDVTPLIDHPSSAAADGRNGRVA